VKGITRGPSNAPHFTFLKSAPPPHFCRQLIFAVIRGFAQQHTKNVSFGFLSLRQLHLAQPSPRAYKRGEIPTFCGAFNSELCTAPPAPIDAVFSVGVLFS
jgi:hypothetical protein